MDKNSKVRPLKSFATESIASSKAFGLTPLKSSSDEHPKKHTSPKSNENVPKVLSSPIISQGSPRGSGGTSPPLPQFPSTSKDDRPNHEKQYKTPLGEDQKNVISNGIFSASSIPAWHPLDIRSYKSIPVGTSTSEPLLNLRDSKESVSFGSALPDELQPLEDTTMMFVVKQLRPLKFQNSVPMLQYFKIFNQSGEHILSAGEVRISRCVNFATYEFLCFVFTKEGNPFMTIAQRNEAYNGCCGFGCSKTHNKDLLVHQQADGWLNRKYRLISGDDLDETNAHVHVSLVTGAFLGHIWIGGDQFIIHDIEYNPNITVVRRELAQLEKVVLPRNERRASAFNESLATSCDVKYELYVETAQVGEVCGNVTLRANDDDYGSSNPDHCVGALYPLNMEAEEKALVLAFLLYYIRTDGTCRSVCGMLMSRYCIACYIFLIVALITIPFLWHMGSKTDY